MSQQLGNIFSGILSGTIVVLVSEVLKETDVQQP